MAHEKLLDQLRRLLEYSGSRVTQVAVTTDGATAVVYIDDKPHRVFIAPIDDKPVVQELSSSFLIDPY